MYLICRRREQGASKKGQSGDGDQRRPNDYRGRQIWRCILVCFSVSLARDQTTSPSSRSSYPTTLATPKENPESSIALPSQHTNKKKPKNKNSLEGRKSLASHSNPSEGTLIVGHTSSLLAMTLTSDERLIVTSDRDEHIRVSRFPRGYNIERYCLGHTKYVSAIHLPLNLPGKLVSAGGDRHLFLWDYMTGDLIDRLEIWDAVYSATKVSSQRRKWKRMEAKAGTGWRAQKRKSREEKERMEKLKKQSEEGEKSREEVDEDAEMDVDEPLLDENGDGVDSTVIREERRVEGTLESSLPSVLISAGGITINERRAQLPSLEEVIVISKVDTLQCGDRYALVFSAVGANAIFVIPYDNGGSSSSSVLLPSKNSIQPHVFPSPVLDFVVIREGDGAAATSPSSSCRVLVTIDTSFQGETARSEVDTPETTEVLPERGPKSSINGFYLLDWRGDGCLVEQSAESSRLLAQLRSWTTFPATLTELGALELYGALTALPKSEEIDDLEEGRGVADEGSLLHEERSVRTPNEDAEGEDGSDSRRLKGENDVMTRKEVKKLGRQKWLNKMKKVGVGVGEGAHEQEVIEATSIASTPLSEATTRRIEEGEEQEGQRASKRAKIED
ncbi:tRNA (guanine-N(7)-)-methyltransferase non-catalytic subunit trm82 [Serendipita sp. 411]|nr:tRNA (guanine-N(7)-)-methyltransferase non-catalytic subunit trm82 [Serendipita sp. 411]